MSSEQMQAAIKDLQDTMVVMAHIQKTQSEHLGELVNFRIQSERLQIESEKFRRRTEENLSEITDKLKGLIGYVAGQRPKDPQR
ncbi:MAG: hypothetical protein WBE37_31730 [Bryobacteraceae bacterium]